MDTKDANHQIAEIFCAATYDTSTHHNWQVEEVLKIFALPFNDLIFKAAAFYKDQPATIYVNENKIAKKQLATNIKKFKIRVGKQNLKKGINTVYFMFGKTYRPKDVLPNSADNRNIAAKFSKVSLQDLND